VELAKKYSSEDSAGFVNGILDQVLKHDPRLEEKRVQLAIEAGDRL